MAQERARHAGLLAEELENAARRAEARLESAQAAQEAALKETKGAFLASIEGLKEMSEEATARQVEMVEAAHVDRVKAWPPRGTGKYTPCHSSPLPKTLNEAILNRPG